MKKGYIPKDQRKKILLLSDDIRTHSGIGTMSKEIVLNTAHHYNWVNLGGAVKHPEKGKGFDISPDINSITGLTDADVKVIPVDGYGDPTVLRNIIIQEKPDAILHFTDPRYWIWLYRMENEIRQKYLWYFILFGMIYLIQCIIENFIGQMICIFVFLNKQKIL